jgi:hypothetical protein
VLEAEIRAAKAWSEPRHTADAMNRGVNTWWLNALIVTTVVVLWLSLLGGIIIGVQMAKAGDISVTTPDCVYDPDHGVYYDRDGNYCTP